VGTLVTALGLALILEGLLPFLNPPMWREVFSRVAAMTDGQIRWIGMMSMVAGLAIVAITG